MTWTAPDGSQKTGTASMEIGGKDRLYVSMATPDAYKRVYVLRFKADGPLDKDGQYAATLVSMDHAGTVGPPRAGGVLRGTVKADGSAIKLDLNLTPPGGKPSYISGRLTKDLSWVALNSDGPLTAAAPSVAAAPPPATPAAPPSRSHSMDCLQCKGAGSYPQAKARTIDCSSCNGRGSRVDEYGSLKMCLTCAGKGTRTEVDVVEAPCPICRGTGLR